MTFLLALIVAHSILQTPDLDYQPAIARGANGELVIVFERLSPQTLSGDLLAMRSHDGGVTWSAPTTVASTATNERAPALLFDGTQYVLFHLGETSPSAFRIFRATSPDGIVWTQHGRIELGWATSGEINPDVIRESSGALVMTYHRLGGRSYIAKSTDGGATWDTLRTAITETNSALPRIAKRESDGTYLVTYQVNPGDGRLQLYAKMTKSVYDWTAAASPLSVDGNDHDSDPHVLSDGRFAVAYASQSDADSFSLRLRTSADGAIWSAPLILTNDLSVDDVQPHLFDIDAKNVGLLWSRGTSQTDRDLWLDARTLVSAAKRRAVR